MENFRETSLNAYKLDHTWYYTTTGFAWDCMLKTTKQKLELLTDVDMLLMFERGKRGTEKVKCFAQKLFRSEKHDIYTVEHTKRGLNPFDDERYLTKGSTDTLPQWHYKTDIPKENFIQHLKDCNK